MAAGSFLPEITVLVANALHPDRAVEMPERSHWVVFRECEDMLSDPDATLPSHYYTWYRVEAGGIAYLFAAGLAFALSAGFARSRSAAAAFAGLHALVLLGLAAGSWVVWSSTPAAEGTTTTRAVGVAALLFGALGLGQSILGARAVRRAGRGRLCAVDGANLLPALFLFVVGAGLYVSLRRHPNWPAGGYLLTASGAAIVLAGIALRRGPAAAGEPVRPGDPTRVPC